MVVYEPVTLESMELQGIYLTFDTEVEESVSATFADLSEFAMTRVSEDNPLVNINFEADDGSLRYFLGVPRVEASLSNSLEKVTLDGVYMLSPPTEGTIRTSSRRSP